MRAKPSKDPDPDFEISEDTGRGGAGSQSSTSSSSVSLVDSLQDQPVDDEDGEMLVEDDEMLVEDSGGGDTASQKRKNPFARKGAPKKLSSGQASQGVKATKATQATQAVRPPPKDVEEAVFSPSELENMQKALLSWYDENHRVLPWRRNVHSRLSPATVASQPYQAPPSDLSDDAFIYYVWVCEIMSQQTQVSRVCEYFTKWVRKWPTVVDLAGATQEEVNDMWAGLGYYRRAKYLLEGAKYVVREMGGAFPRSADKLQKIPGVGPYTSRAIASQACGEPVAVVDGNVVRVLSRLRRIGGDPKSAQMVKMFAEVADRTLAKERPGDFNQAVMELGATVCVPNTVPSCSQCPVRAWCRAEKDGVVMEYPSKVPKAAKREERVGVSILRAVEDGGNHGWKDGKFLLLKRPEEGLLAGLWEFPLKSLGDGDGGGLDVASEGASKAKAKGRARIDVMDAYLREEVGLPIKRVVSRTSLGEQLSIFTHIRMTMEIEELCVVLGEDGRDGKDGKDGKDGSAASLEDSKGMHWVTYDALCERSLTSSVKKCLELYRAHHVQKAKKASGIAKFFVKAIK